MFCKNDFDTCQQVLNLSKYSEQGQCSETARLNEKRTFRKLYTCSFTPFQAQSRKDISLLLLLRKRRKCNAKEFAVPSQEGQPRDGTCIASNLPPIYSDYSVAKIIGDDSPRTKSFENPLDICLIQHHTTISISTPQISVLKTHNGCYRRCGRNTHRTTT